MDQREAPLFGAFDALAVDDGDRRTCFASHPFPRLDVERMMDACQRPVPVPQIEILVHRRLRRKVLGQGAPLAAGRQQIENRVQHLAHIHRARTAATLGRRDRRFDQRPLRIRQIAWVTKPRPLVRPPVFDRPHRAPPFHESGAPTESQPIPANQLLSERTLRSRLRGCRLGRSRLGGGRLHGRGPSIGCSRRRATSSRRNGCVIGSHDRAPSFRPEGTGRAPAASSRWLQAQFCLGNPNLSTSHRHRAVS